MFKWEAILFNLRKSVCKAIFRTLGSSFLILLQVSLKSRYTEDDLWELSLQREPRGTSNSTVRELTSSKSQKCVVYNIHVFGMVNKAINIYLGLLYVDVI